MLLYNGIDAQLWVGICNILLAVKKDVVTWDWVTVDWA